MHRLLATALVMLGLLASTSMPATAGEFGTREEAQAMTEKAAALLKAEGDKAFPKLQDPKGEFIDRDLYVFVFDSKGTFLVHGAKQALVGKEGLPIRDPNGFPIIAEFLKVKDTAWVDYHWLHPKTNKIQPKSAYIINTGTYWVGVGYYK
ncbi:MAG: cache domain-containing protein [Alphaproteobacteria bacterium]|nr:MAG: cache domain-containing protein [Alphaproteobacteria bacterium]